MIKGKLQHITVFSFLADFVRGLPGLPGKNGRSGDKGSGYQGVAYKYDKRKITTHYSFFSFAGFSRAGFSGQKGSKGYASMDHSMIHGKLQPFQKPQIRKNFDDSWIFENIDQTKLR